MNYLLSPPSSPSLSPVHQQHIATCGVCTKILGADWFCSDCHQKCSSCNRFLSQDEYCSRCWTFDSIQQQYIRKSTFTSHIHQPIHRTTTTTTTTLLLPTPSNSTDK